MKHCYGLIMNPKKNKNPVERGIGLTVFINNDERNFAVMAYSKSKWSKRQRIKFFRVVDIRKTIADANWCVVLEYQSGAVSHTYFGERRFAEKFVSYAVVNYGK